MSSELLSLPRELRNQIYELVLLHPQPIEPFSHYGWQQHSLLGLLSVNKMVHREASSIFYGQNRFDLFYVTCETLASFWGQIGRNNADCIRHIYIRFPDVCFDSEDVSIKENSIDILANIQSSCANLSTLKIPLFSTDGMELQLAAYENPKVATEALELANTHFRRIQSLDEIIVEVCEEAPSAHVRKEMESLGWTIHTPRMDYWLGYFKLLEHGGCDSDSVGDDDDDDNLDIGTDSDFIEKSGV